MAGALETHISSLSDALIDGMSFAGRNTASYITARKSTSFQTQSLGIFSPANLRIMRFNMADSEGAWMDGSVLRFAMTINNTGTSNLTPNTNSPSSMFRRVRLLVGGTEIYDLLDYGIVHQMMTMQLPAARLMEDAIEGWGATNTASTDPSTLCHPFTAAPIANGTGRRVLCQILCPFFSQGKMLPLSPLGSCVLEIELGGYDDCFTTGTNITNLWEIQRPVISRM